MAETTPCYGMIPCTGCTHCNDPFVRLSDWCHNDPDAAAEEIARLRAVMERAAEEVDGWNDGVRDLLRDALGVK